MLLLFKNEACRLLGDNWHTRRVMCLDGKREVKEREIKREVAKGLVERVPWIS